MSLDPSKNEFHIYELDPETAESRILSQQYSHDESKCMTNSQKETAIAAAINQMDMSTYQPGVPEPLDQNLVYSQSEPYGPGGATLETVNQVIEILQQDRKERTKRRKRAKRAIKKDDWMRKYGMNKPPGMMEEESFHHSQYEYSDESDLDIRIDVASLDDTKKVSDPKTNKSIQQKMRNKRTKKLRLKGEDAEISGDEITSEDEEESSVDEFDMEDSFIADDEVIEYEPDTDTEYESSSETEKERQPSRRESTIEEQMSEENIEEIDNIVEDDSDNEQFVDDGKYVIPEESTKKKQEKKPKVPKPTKKSVIKSKKTASVSKQMTLDAFLRGEPYPVPKPKYKIVSPGTNTTNQITGVPDIGTELAQQQYQTNENMFRIKRNKMYEIDHKTVAGTRVQFNDLAFYIMNESAKNAIMKLAGIQQFEHDMINVYALNQEFMKAPNRKISNTKYIDYLYSMLINVNVNGIQMRILRRGIEYYNGDPHDKNVISIIVLLRNVQRVNNQIIIQGEQLIENGFDHGMREPFKCIILFNEQNIYMITNFHGRLYEGKEWLINKDFPMLRMNPNDAAIVLENPIRTVTTNKKNVNDGKKVTKQLLNRTPIDMETDNTLDLDIQLDKLPDMEKYRFYTERSYRITRTRNRKTETVKFGWNKVLVHIFNFDFIVPNAITETRIVRETDTIDFTTFLRQILDDYFPEVDMIMPEVPNEDIHDQVIDREHIPK